VLFTNDHGSVNGLGRTRSLLELDPDLARTLPGERYAAARAGLRVSVHQRVRGPWPMKSVPREGLSPHLGVLILDGVIASDILLEDVVSTELLGPGDILRPWPLEDSERLLSDEARWMVLADCRFALLDQRLTASLLQYPEIYAVLLERMDSRARRFATTQAIAQLTRVDRRVLAMLWHLAERWGRVTADGVLVPLDISHRLLAQLVGARRPTVSTALAALAREGSVQRRADGAWLLLGDPPGDPNAGEVTPVSRRRLLVDHREAKPRREIDDIESRPAAAGRYVV
jgi:hypothetical protein